MCCKKCKKSKKIVNKHFGLCLECNNERLHGSKYGKQYKPPSRGKSLLKWTKKGVKPKARGKSTGPKLKINISEIQEDEIFYKIQGSKTFSKIQEDEIFYKKCFDMSDHKCEECGRPLPEDFRDENGKVIARWRYSHILPKSVYLDLRHDVRNINHLCLAHHQQWENGDKESMKIYKKNLKKFPNYL